MSKEEILKRLDAVKAELKEVKHQIEEAASKKFGYDKLALNQIASLIQMAIDAIKALEQAIDRWLE